MRTFCFRPQCSHATSFDPLTFHDITTVMESELVFGWRTAILLVAFVQLILLAAALTRPIQNRLANRTLAALLLVLAGMIVPWMIGFAGFYDRWQWLSFAPFAISLAIAPLAYLYVYSITTGHWPEKGAWHLVSALLQFLYLSGAFAVLRQPFKNEWLDRSSFAYDLITNAGVVLGLSAYGVASVGVIRAYRARLDRQRSDVQRLALGWLARAVFALFVLLTVWAVYSIRDLASPLGYSGLMGLYVAIAGFALFLGIEGWRHASTVFPTMAQLEPQAVPATDWSVKAEDWAERIRRERLFADPELSVPTLAKSLGTNSAYVSRAFNEGLGESFSSFINRLRCEEIADRLRDGAVDDLLDLALDSGFSSKASFNRSFRATFGASPSVYRQRHGSIPK